ncbi:MAG TPA: transcription termination/antitermination protein NusG [Phycisphaerales bacterium]|nr:transcription termination/antitermination protein NusG [Phycisphaerales bacterium]HMP38028.1 transcription termination/antitermination protein NusG [Phycisphaerales bacterium]
MEHLDLEHDPASPSPDGDPAAAPGVPDDAASSAAGGSAGSSAAPAEEPTAAAAEEPAAGPKAKSLGRGARKRGDQPSPRTLTGAGVATSKALMSTRRARPAKASEATAAQSAAPAEAGSDEERFDPATDLPMYREGMDWFVLRVASNKESSVRETLLRKVQIEGMEDLVGRIMVPTEKTKTLKAGKQRITETKLYPGYVFVEMKLEPDGRIPQDVFFLIKETSGVGDFVGTAGRPTPMATHEVEKMLFDSRRPEEAPTLKMDFRKGDSVTIKEGPFENFRGTVDELLPDRGLVRVLVTIFGRQAPIELEYWQIAKAEDEGG